MKEKTEWTHLLEPVALGLGIALILLGIGGCVHLIEAGEAKRTMATQPSAP